VLTDSRLLSSWVDSCIPQQVARLQCTALHQLQGMHTKCVDALLQYLPDILMPQLAFAYGVLCSSVHRQQQQ
jgi:hypothetical protein